jgi:hypothetical protein
MTLSSASYTGAAEPLLHHRQDGERGFRLHLREARALPVPKLGETLDNPDHIHGLEMRGDGLDVDIRELSRPFLRQIQQTPCAVFERRITNGVDILEFPEQDAAAPFVLFL